MKPIEMTIDDLVLEEFYNKMMETVECKDTLRDTRALIIKILKTIKVKNVTLLTGNDCFTVIYHFQDDYIGKLPSRLRLL